MNTNHGQYKDTIPYLLKRRAKENGKDIIYSFPSTNQHYSWVKLWTEVAQVAKGLLQLGVRKGDTVAILMPGRIELIVSMYAAACIGAIIVPLNTYSKKDELEQYLRDSCPTVMLLSREASHIPHLQHLSQMLRDCKNTGEDGSWLPLHIFVLDALPGEGKGFFPYEELFVLGEQIAEEQFTAVCEANRPTDPLILLYTSGTTGFAKGVLRSTASFLTTSQANNAVKKSPDSDNSFLMKLTDRITKHFSILNLLPLYHLGGFATVFTALKSCNIRIVMLGYFHPLQALAAVQQQKCRVLVGTPFMIQRITAAPQRKEYRLSSLLGVAFTSAAVNSSMVNRLVKELKLSFFMVSYGSSEAGAVANGTCLIENKRNLLLHLLYRLLKRTSLLSGMLDYKQFEGETYSIAGKVDRSVEVSIVHPDTGRALLPYENGEILIRSHRVMRYTKEPSEQIAISEDGWYKSGDLGFLNERNELTITGRMNRIISRGGEKISPVEVENALLTYCEVEEAFVLGIPDEMYGEQVCACLVAKPGAEQSAEKIRKELSPHLSAFKLPYYVLFVPALPMSATGKISVAEIRKLLQDGMKELRKNA
jgi:fatty-acyl-CoA synthase